MSHNVMHDEQQKYLKKIEGQIRGIQRMIEERRYCVDIITQIHSIIGALYKVEGEIFKKHVKNCFVTTLQGKSEYETEKKIKEVVELVMRFRKAT